MESINTNVSSMVNDVNKTALNNVGFNKVAGINNFSFVDDIAALAPSSVGNMSTFEVMMNKCASFKDMISTAQGGISAMKKEGEGIRDLIAQAKEEGVTPELLDKIQAEVDARVAEIQRIRENTKFDGVNPFDESFSLDVPDILGLLNADSKEEASDQIVAKMADFDIDISAEGDGFNISGSAKIEIGYTADGALKINVDASMDYDLSGLVTNGVNSDDAMQLINNFIDMLGIQEGELGDAQNFLDAIIEQIFDVMDGQAELPEGIEIEADSSETLKGKMVQHASITLDGMAGQAPSIAINIL